MEVFMLRYEAYVSTSTANATGGFHNFPSVGSKSHQKSSEEPRSIREEKTAQDPITITEDVALNEGFAVTPLWFSI